MSINLARIFANALARRVAFVVVAAIIAFFSVHEKATAGDLGCSSAGTCDEGAAYALCWQHARNIPNSSLKTVPVCSSAAGVYRASKCHNGAPPNEGYEGCYEPVGQDTSYYYFSGCGSRSSQTTTRLPLPGSKQCINGCMVTYMLNADGDTSTRSPSGSICSNTKDNCGVGFFYNVLMNVCQPFAPECKEGEVLKNGVCEREPDCPEGMVAVQGGTAGAVQSGELYCKPAETECPAGNIKAPSGQCLPGEGQCAAGEAKKKDGTCGKDGNNDGVPDDEDEDEENDTTKETFSGGDSCNAPPSCNGGPIDCGMARIQWRIDCNTRKNVNISGGSCAAVPLCTGEKCNAMEYAQLLQTWRGTCALEKLANAEGSTPGSNDDLIDHLNAQRDAEIGGANASAAQGDGHEGVDEDGIWSENAGEDFNPNLFGGGTPGSCSFSAELEIMGHPIELPAQFWTLAAMIGWLTVACAYLWVAFQLS